MNSKHSNKLYFGLIILVVLIVTAVVRSGLLSKTEATQIPKAVEVKAMQVIQQDARTNYEFVGQVKSKNEVKIMSKVSGNIVEKMVNGGDSVYKGQPLFRIDNKQYRSAINSARATLNKSKATLNNDQKDVERYKQLTAINGIAQQTLDTQVAQAEEDAATVAVNQASLQQAIEDEQDTLILSPVDGRIDVNDVSMGSYVVAGSTTMATVSSVDPVWVQFSMSENEYLDLVQLGNGTLPSTFKDNLKLTLSNGTQYPLLGRIEQVDKGVTDTTGTITLKASFSNPQNILMPGMFARVVTQGALHQGALLIPQRAVTELLNKTFVTVVTDENKAESREVTMGERIGNLWLVQNGLTVNDRVIVEGTNKVKAGTALQVTMIQADELQIPAKR
ncbi:efflux RND transporter periplasmic adaptor subunit [Pelosinus sp. UFO1]|uniref:efflux RND transporter periplasmic adaptor subunit n=1 Tax=Pelosinus sp. UFO1 TaxID=484770 RepID=UPI0004D1F3AE|nr:efflux RND transporter periplasmic adaptor subunit [Pelosinus sp. UFO1]AIF54230.1 efflux transporter, RND family, MFP subunit [Pelosinus sp. UFO1]